MIRHDMPAAEYHAHVGLNASTLKAVARHPLAKVRYDLDHRAGYNPAFSLGTAAHSLILEHDATDLVIVDFPDYRTKEARISRDAALAAGKVPLLPHEHDQVRAMRDAVMDHPDAGPLLTGHAAEVSVFADVEGDACKARLDAWHESAGLIVDLKTARTADPASLARDFYSLGYDQQAAHYVDVMASETGFAPDFVIVAVEKEEPYLVSVTRFDPADLDQAREDNRAARRRWLAAVAANHYPGYTGIHTLARPRYLRRSTDDD